jgi:hypothetical protein
LAPFPGDGVNDIKLSGGRYVRLVQRQEFQEVLCESCARWTRQAFRIAGGNIRPGGYFLCLRCGQSRLGWETYQRCAIELEHAEGS